MIGIEDIARALDGKKSGSGYQCKCPVHDDDRASLSLSRGDKGIVFHCHAGCAQTDVLDALRARGLWNGTKKEGAARKIITTYDYETAEDELLFQVVRFEPKDFRQRRPNGKGGWIWNATGVKQVPYLLPELSRAIAARETIFVVEGEKDVDRLRLLGITATCNAGGAGKWRPEHSQYLKGANVIIIPDNDEPGRKHAQQVRESLTGIAAAVRIAELPGLPPKGDVSDWLAQGGTAEELLRLVTDVSHVTASVGAELLNDVHGFLGRFVAYPSEDARVAHALWIAHTHLMDAWESTPRIAFLSPEPGSGKTRALEITETLVPRPVEAINATPAYLFRKVSDPDGLPTILYDEIDTLFGPRAKDNEEIRGILNAGHRRGAMAGRCVVRGKVIETEELPAYCAVALAGLGKLPDSILTRSVIVRMRRRSPTESIEPYRRRLHAPEGHALRDRLSAWASDIAQKVNAWPDMPDGITDRNADVWESLLAVADTAGGSWPGKARGAAVTLVTLSKAGTPSLGVRLLADLYHVFGQREVMSTENIIKALCQIDEAPWADLKGKEIDARRLANYLKPYGITSKVVRIGAETVRGYSRHDLHDAWVRYLPMHPPGDVTSVTNVTPEAGDVTHVTHVTHAEGHTGDGEAF